MSESIRLRDVVGTEEEGVASEAARGSSPRSWSVATLRTEPFDREDVVAAAIILEERDEDVTAPGHKNPARWSSDTHLMPLVSQSSEREDLDPRIRHDPRVVVT